MKAVTFDGTDRPLGLEELPVPEAGPGQLLLKVDACGICGSDLHAYQTSLPPVGTVMGHEFAGEVVEIGEGVADDWRKGDRAIAVGGMVCGQCNACLADRAAQCENIELIGFTRNGAYAEYVICQASGSVRLPPEIDYPRAALAEPLAVGLVAFRDCQLPLGGNVLVIGAGVIGLAVAKWACFFGAEHIVVSDLDETRLERASATGATATINASENSDPVQAFMEATGTTPDVIVECVGRPMLQQLIDVAPIGTHIVAVGASMELDAISSVVAAQKQTRLTFSFGYGLEELAFVIRMISEGRLKTDELITRSVTLSEVPAAFEELLQPNGHCKVMIRPWSHSPEYAATEETYQ